MPPTQVILHAEPANVRLLLRTETWFSRLSPVPTNYRVFKWARFTSHVASFDRQASADLESMNHLAKSARGKLSTLLHHRNCAGRNDDLHPSQLLPNSRLTNLKLIACGLHLITHQLFAPFPRFRRTPLQDAAKIVTLDAASVSAAGVRAQYRGRQATFPTGPAHLEACGGPTRG